MIRSIHPERLLFHTEGARTQLFSSPKDLAETMHELKIREQTDATDLGSYLSQLVVLGRRPCPSVVQADIMTAARHRAESVWLDAGAREKWLNKLQAGLQIQAVEHRMAEMDDPPAMHALAAESLVAGEVYVFLGDLRHYNKADHRYLVEIFMDRNGLATSPPRILDEPEARFVLVFSRDSEAEAMWELIAEEVGLRFARDVIEGLDVHALLEQAEQAGAIRILVWEDGNRPWLPCVILKTDRDWSGYIQSKTSDLGHQVLKMDQAMIEMTGRPLVRAATDGGRRTHPRIGALA